MDIELEIYLKSKGYDQDDIEIMVEEILPVAKANIGWKDNRKDSRYIVKFPDIVYDDGFNLDDATMNDLFSDFCHDTAEWVDEELKVKNCDLDRVLTSYDIGHYRGLELTRQGVTEITEVNLFDVVESAYNCFIYDAGDMLRQHIEVVNTLQELEDTYKDWWNEFMLDYKESLNG